MKHLFIALLITAAWATAAHAQKATLCANSSQPIRHLPAQTANNAITGSNFMLQCDTVDFWTREKMVVDAVLSGNVPDSLRYFKKITYTTPIVDSIEVFRQPHTVSLWVTCDYLSIGTNTDFVRMPMGPLAAQEIADSLHCMLPTSFIVDRINDARQGAIEIFPFRPLGERNTWPIVFQDSNNAINALFRAKGYHFGQLISGLKKDIILTHRLWNDAKCLNRVAIYGWHRPDGSRVQPTYVGHVNFYVDYSHGVRLVSRVAEIDGKTVDLKAIVEDPKLFRLVSDESSPIVPASYFAN
ncbi:MAG: hypothetical protein ACI308_07680 [Muribaculaceae bacterium]